MPQSSSRKSSFGLLALVFLAQTFGTDAFAGDRLTAAEIRKLTPGTRLVRDWHGVGHTITVLERGFAYDGQTWASLTAIAKAITGAKWNGPRFFGLAERKR